MQTKAAHSLQARTSEHQWAREHWCNFGTVLLGMWLIATAVSSNYQSVLLERSDLICGALLLAFGLISNKVPALRWLSAITGTWLLFAPLIFWAPTSVSYTNDTLVGTLAIILSFAIPGVPGTNNDTESGAESPRGWSYNPSSWSQRIPLIALALIGFFLARYMAAYQLGHVDSSWDPFLGDSTERVLKSEVSKAFPVSDAGLGAASYIIDAIAGLIGGIRRWRTMPWMVLLFGLLVIPPGIVSIILVVLQPIGVGAWCSLCLLASIVMLIMVPMTVDEVIATVQYLRQAKRAGLPFWRTLFAGGPELQKSKQQPVLAVVNDSAPHVGSATSPSSISIPAGIGLAAIVGAWLMLSPVFLKTTSTALLDIYIISALAITFSFIAFAEVCRSVRLLNILLGIALIVSPFIMTGFSQPSTINAIVCGIALSILSLRKGRIRESYANWNQFII